MEFVAAIGSLEASIGFLRRKNILRTVPPKCDLCNRDMTQVRRAETFDGFVWRCPDHKGRAFDSLLDDIAAWYNSRTDGAAIIVP